jgi:uncharacterized membrane protein YhaH (DUF805 family)/cold shock CspA family protein
MRGKVIHFDPAQGFGFVAGDDGGQYAVAAENLRGRAALGPGDVVEFRPSGGRAYDVFVVGGQPAVEPAAQEDALPRVHFGRAAGTVSAPPAGPGPRTGLWDYFLAAMTTRYADFGGRARRKEYWGFVLFFFVVLIALSLAGTAIDMALGNLDSGDGFPVVTVALSTLFTLASIIPAIAVAIRRQHDIGLSGWFYLAIVLPMGSLVLIVFALIPSQMQDNGWGPVPAR